MIFSIKDSTSSTTPVSAASGGYLARPSNIYAESQAEAITPTLSVEEPVSKPQATAGNEQDELLELQMQIGGKGRHSSGGYAVSRSGSVTFVPPRLRILPMAGRNRRAKT